MKGDNMRPKHSHKPRNEEGGVLVVTGQDEVKIPIMDFPHRVEVLFKKKHGPPPCNPHHHHHDRLEWEVHRNYQFCKRTYNLIIRWNVQDIREIIWMVQY